MLPNGVDLVILCFPMWEYCPFVVPYIWLLKSRMLISKLRRSK